MTFTAAPRTTGGDADADADGAETNSRFAETALSARSGVGLRSTSLAATIALASQSENPVRMTRK